MTEVHRDCEASEAETFCIAIGDVRYAVPRRCPHRGGYLQYGEINRQRQTITCPLHYSVFCLQTGAQLAGPPCGALEVRAVEE